MMKGSTGTKGRSGDRPRHKSGTLAAPWAPLRCPLAAPRVPQVPPPYTGEEHSRDRQVSWSGRGRQHLAISPGRHLEPARRHDHARADCIERLGF